MANIASLLTIIKNAVYGKDMRAALHDSINLVNVDTESRQTKLVSGTSIKTVNGISLLGSGNVVTPLTPPSQTFVEQAAGWAENNRYVPNFTQYATWQEVAGKPLYFVSSFTSSTAGVKTLRVNNGSTNIIGTSEIRIATPSGLSNQIPANTLMIGQVYCVVWYSTSENIGYWVLISPDAGASGGGSGATTYDLTPYFKIPSGATGWSTAGTGADYCQISGRQSTLYIAGRQKNDSGTVTSLDVYEIDWGAIPALFALVPPDYNNSADIMVNGKANNSGSTFCVWRLYIRRSDFSKATITLSRADGSAFSAFGSIQAIYTGSTL